MITFTVDARIEQRHKAAPVIVSWYGGAGDYQGQERTTLGEIQERMQFAGATQTYIMAGRIGYRLVTGEVARVRFE